MEHGACRLPLTAFSASLWAVAFSMTLTGCQQLAPPAADDELPQVILGAPGDGAAAAILPTLQEAQLERARWSLPQIDRELRRTLVDLTTQPGIAPTTRPGLEPPPEAIKLYLLGREQIVDGQIPEGLASLEKAQKLDPESFVILQLMGKACLVSHQLARGALYLQRALALHPQDVESNFMLGRYWLQRQETPRAALYLLTAARSPERRDATAMSPLVSYYLAQSLEALKFYQAAGEEYEHLLLLLAEPQVAYRYDRELVVLNEQNWSLHSAASDAFYQIREWNRALPHAIKALEHDRTDPALNARVITLHARLLHQEAAIGQALDFVERAEASRDSLALLRWTYQKFHRLDQLLGDLQQRLASKGQQTALLLAVAGLQESAGQYEEALASLSSYLQVRPQDKAVLRRALEMARAHRLYPQGFLLLVRAYGAGAIEEAASPLRELLGSEPTARELAVLEQTSIGAQDQVARAYLLGVLARSVEKPDQARRYFEAVLLRRADFWPVYPAYLSLLLGREEFPLANQLVQQAWQLKKGNPDAYLLLIENHAAQGRLGKALELAQQARAEYPQSAPLGLALVNILRARGQSLEAISQVQALLTANPTLEEGYRQLIELYLANQKVEQALETLGKLLHQIPDSRYGQVLAGQLYVRVKKYREADELFRRLQRRYPQDGEILVARVQGLVAQDQKAQAITLLEEATRQGEPQPLVVETLAELYRQQSRPMEALSLLTSLAGRYPDSERWHVLYAGELLRQEKAPLAEEVMRQTLEKHPESMPLLAAFTQYLTRANRAPEAVAVAQRTLREAGPTAERLYLLAHLQEQAGQDEQATLRELLKRVPDHAGANNDLGYYLAERGENLEQARVMISGALENQPNNAAFLDSLGWVYYKLGRFKEAAEQLERAASLLEGQDAAMLGHLGDTYWRLGQKPQALVRWKQALELLDKSQRLRPDERKLKASLNQRIQQEKKGQEVTVSPLP